MELYPLRINFIPKYILFFILSFSLNYISAQNCNYFEATIAKQKMKAFEGMPYEQLPGFYFCRAKYFEENTLIDSAFYYHTKAIKMWVHLGESKDALVLLERLNALSGEMNLPEKFKGITAYNEGYIYSRFGSIEDKEVAEEAFEKALVIFKKQQDTISLVDVYLGMGYLYWEDFDTKTAEQFFNQAAFLLKAKPNFSKSLEVTYWQTINQQNKLYFDKELGAKEHRFVLNNYLKILEYYQDDTLSDSKYQIALIKNDIGYYYWVLSKLDVIATPKLNIQETHKEWQVRMLDSSIYHYGSAIILWEENFSKPHREIANTWNNIGLAYHDKYWHDINPVKLKNKSINYTLAKQSYQTALSIRKVVQEEAHFEIARNLSNIGSLFETQNSYKEALKQYDFAIEISRNKFNIKKFLASTSLETPNSPPQLLYALKRKANLLNIWFNKNHQLSYLKESLDSYLSALNVIEYMLIRYRGSDSVLKIIQKNWWIYEKGINVAINLFEETQNPIYKEIALQISERSKANITKVSLQKKEAASFGIPNSEIAATDKALYNKVINLSRSLVNSRRKSANIVQITKIESDLLEAERNHNEFLKELEKIYPKFVEIKYGGEIHSLSKTRLNFLKGDSTAILEYFVGNNQIYAFGISQDTLAIHVIDRDSFFDKQTENLIAALTKNNFKYEWKEQFNQFTTSSHFLFQQIIEPLFGSHFDKFKNLIIIPDNYLNYIPFEILILNLPKDTNNYAALNYLFFEKNIRYAHSTSKLATNQTMSFDEKKKINFLGFACTYNDGPSKNRLIGAANAIRYGKKILGGQIYIDQQVNKSLITSPNYRPKVLQISMHATIPDAFPANSSFELCSDTTELNIFDFYQADYTNIDLIILASCETGNGVYRKGEGIASLAKSITYAGCNSSIMSLWRLNDQSSEKLMRNFYENIKSGMGKASALSYAKKSYLNSLKNNKIQAHLMHPYYWSGVILSGDNKVIHFDNLSTNGINYYASILFLIISLFLIGYFLFRFRVSRRSV